jgi:hypothetical protein
MPRVKDDLVALSFGVVNQAGDCPAIPKGPPSGVRKAKPYNISSPADPFTGGQCQMEHTKMGPALVGLIVLIFLGFLAFDVAYLAIQ